VPVLFQISTSPLPVMPVDVLGLGGPVTQPRQQRAALFDGHPDHVIGCRASQ